ncbi:MAG: threonine/homoserine exporter RhtA [Bilophila sp.]
MTRPAPFGTTSKSVFIPVGMVLVSMLSIQCSASLAKSLFALISPAGVTALRLLFSALILLAVFKPWRTPITRAAWRPIIIYGLALGCMNLTFYIAIQRIPLGIAVALEFTGPLAIAMWSARRLVDFVWVGFAVTGVCLLLPLRQTVGSLDAIDPFGTCCALAAGFFWALYIIFGRKAGMANGTASVALGTLIGALIIFPVGVATEGLGLFSLAVLPYAVLIGIFSSALPYGLEMVALARIPAQTFGILMSLEPALGALSGFIFLGEQLSVTQWTALLCIIVASAGATLTIRRG